MTDIAIAHTTMFLSGVPESSATEGLIRSIAEAMEREFEATLGPLQPVVTIGRIDVDIVLDWNQVHDLAAIAAHKIVTHIASAVGTRSAHISSSNTTAEALSIDGLSIGDDRVATLLAAAQALRAGSGPVAMTLPRRPMTFLVVTNNSDDLAHDRAPETALFSPHANLPELLARIARSGRTDRFVRALMREGAWCDGAAVRGMLRQIKAMLLRLSRATEPVHDIDDPAGAISEPHDGGAWHAAVARARSRLQARITRMESTPGMPRFPALQLLLAIADEGRLEQDRIVRVPAITTAVLAAIEEIDDVESSREVFGGGQNAVEVVLTGLHTEPPHETPRGTYDAQRGFVAPAIHTNFSPQPSTCPGEISPNGTEYADCDTQLFALLSTREAMAGSTLLELSELIDPEIEARFVCHAAGLVFLAGPLLDLGWVAAVCAVHDVRTILLVSVLREILADMGVDEGLQTDPATWVLAGLAADPFDDDLAAEADTWSVEEVERLAQAGGGAATTLAGACRIWARAVVEETRLRLGSHCVDDLARDVILVSGTILAEDERVTVFLPYPDSYESLLRAGLLRDIPMVPWLGGRSLRLVFVGPEYGASS